MEPRHLVGRGVKTMAERRLSAAFKAHIKQRKDPLTYDRRAYMNADTARAAIPDARAEYRKLRNTAMNRIRKLEKAGYGETETVRQARRYFEDLPKNLSQDQAAQRLPDAARFLTSARGTVGGMRDIERRTAQTFQDRGLDFVNSKNIRQFTEFLDWIGTEKLNAIYYKENGNAPREGRASKKQFRVRDLKQTFEAWRANQ